MEKVAEFINVQSYRQALARLCRLAGFSTADGRRVLDDWELCHKRSVQAVGKVTKRLENEDNALLSVDEVRSDPLLWLQALDEHCYREISPKAYLCNPRIDDGDGLIYMLPIYQKSVGAARSKQFGNLSCWLKHHRVVPLTNPQGIDVDVKGIPTGYKDWVAQHLAGESVRIAVVHFTDGIAPNISYKEPEHFVCNGVSDENKRLETALDHIRHAKRKGAHILLMPELTITPAIRLKIVAELERQNEGGDENHAMSVPLIILGSFHEQIASGWRNHAEAVLGLDGTHLFGCDKRKSVTFNNCKEGIECSPMPLTCLFTPLGLMAMAICKDLFEAEPAAVLASLPLDWLLVPSMSDNINPHKMSARTMHHTGGTIVAVANQEMPVGKTPVPGFVHYDKEPESCKRGLTIVSIAKKESDLTLIVFK
ncbi:MAG: hypothetical protein WCK85_02275 [Chlorobium sp.]